MSFLNNLETKHILILPFLFFFILNVYSQSNQVQIVVENKPWTTGDICTNLNNKIIYEGSIYAGHERIMPWVDMRGWAEFNIPSTIKGKKIINIKLQFYVEDESYANNHLSPGSHNLVITKFPFDVRYNSAWEISEYFDELDYDDTENIYGVNWVAGESTGIKEVTLNKKAIEDIQYSIIHNNNFRIGFWEYDDNASKCTISGKDSEHPPKLLVEYN